MHHEFSVYNADFIGTLDYCPMKKGDENDEQIFIQNMDGTS